MKISATFLSSEAEHPLDRDVRDEFPKRTITEIARGAGYRCSNPECRRPTDAATAAQDGTFTIGVAAHICAAASGGPRYDAAQTSEQRRSKDNGLWLCQNCGKLIDADPNKFTVELLQKWRRDAQTRAFRDVVAHDTGSAQELARLEAAITADDARDADGAFGVLFSRAHAAAADDIARYKRAPTWPGDDVELTLRIHEDKSTPSFSISRLPLAVEVAPEVTIVAPPGTGKTTTVLQLAGRTLDANAIVPLYFRLGDWSTGSKGLLASLSDRPAFKSAAITSDDWASLAQHARLLLLLDGWNELSPRARERLRVEIGQIRRDWPHVKVVATTRRQMLDVPLPGPRIEIELLSQEQQMAIAEAHSGVAGAKIVDEAWRTPGLRELIATPLYLSTLLAGGSQSAVPNTKDAVLQLFVRQHEQAADHGAALQSALRGCHTDVLVALASHLNASGETTMTEADARRVVAAVDARLREEGQITKQLEPLEVLEALVSHHTLMRSGNGFAFQHQQFQEWYASLEVAALMRASAKGDASVRLRLRATVLDQPMWEESVLFATERLSRDADGAEITAHAIRLTLPIDPMLAAEMIYRSAADIWEAVKAEIVTFIARWHKPGTVDRAVRFMIMTGRPEFAPQIWPLAASDDSQTQIPTLRLAPRFRPGVLGRGLSEKVTKLPEPTREHLLSLIADESGVDGMELAVELAKVDPSPKVQADVVASLQFRRADRHVADLMSAAHEETWALVAERGYADKIRNPSIKARLLAEQQKRLEKTTDPAQRLGLLLQQPSDTPSRDEAIAAAIADPAFSDRQGNVTFFAQRVAHSALLKGLRLRLEAGLELPFHARELLSELDPTDEGLIAQAILNVSKDDRDKAVAAVLAGPKTIGKLVDKFVACAQALRHARGDRALSDEYHRIQSRLAHTRPALFAAALLERGATDDPITVSSLAFLMSQHGANNGRAETFAIDAPTKLAWISMLREWTNTLLADPTLESYMVHHLVDAIGRLALQETIPDLKRLIDAKIARETRPLPIDLAHCGNDYQRALIRIGGEEAASAAVGYLRSPSFAMSAALVLKAISDKQLNAPAPSSFRQGPSFDEVASKRAYRVLTPRPTPANTFAEPIFTVVDGLARQDSENDKQLLAIGLASIGLGMPHENQDVLIARVLALPQPLKTKRSLLTAMVLDGIVIKSDLVMQAIDEWLEDAKDPKHAWHKRQHTWEIEPWLELLPFTDRPDAVLEGLTKVKAFYGEGWRKDWERVLDAVAAMPGKAGNDLLAALARMHRDIAHDHTWMRAILGRGTQEAVLLYVDLFMAGVLSGGRNGVDAWHVGRQLAEYVQRFPGLNDELKKRYEAAAVGPGRTMLEHFFGEAATEDDLMVMVAKYAASDKGYDGQMAQAVEAVTLDHVPIADSPNAYNIYPAPVGSLRKKLFALLGGTPREAALASKCLSSIDHLRDEYGMASGDPRHPDIMTERPWPLEAAAVSLSAEKR